VQKIVGMLEVGGNLFGNVEVWKKYKGNQGVKKNPHYRIEPSWSSENLLVDVGVWNRENLVQVLEFKNRIFVGIWIPLNFQLTNHKFN
jgi:hypothetical protein